MSAVGEDAFIDVVNDSDVPIGEVRRRDVFVLHAAFRVVHVLIFNSKNELLIQRLALGSSRHPGYWGSSVAAYLYHGETYELAAKRRMAEELGIQVPILDRLGRISMNDDGSHKFIGIFGCLKDGPFLFDTSHIDRLEFLPVEAILQMRATGERVFTPTFNRVLDFFVVHCKPGSMLI